MGTLYGSYFRGICTLEVKLEYQGKYACNMEHEYRGSKILYYGSVPLVWTCNTVMFMSPYVSFVFLIKKETFNCEKNLTMTYQLP